MDKTKNSIDKCIPVVETIEDLFENGMKRSLGEIHFHSSVKGDVLNLGCGDFKLDQSLNAEGRELHDLQLPDWTAPYLPQFEDETIATIHAYHFLEHLGPEELKDMLSECSRVLAEGGAMNIVVPYFKAALAFFPDHKTFFSEEAWGTLLHNIYYDAMDGRQSNLSVRTNFIAGLTGDNLVVCTQLIKESS